MEINFAFKEPSKLINQYGDPLSSAYKKIGSINIVVGPYLRISHKILHSDFYRLIAENFVRMKYHTPEYI